MRMLPSLRRWLIVAMWISAPTLCLALTGAIITPYTFQGASAGAGNGQIAVRFNSAADESHPTQWRLITAQGPGAWTAVTKATVTSPVTRRALTYAVEFRRTTTTPSDAAPVTRTVTVVENQLAILKVKYQ